MTDRYHYVELPEDTWLKYDALLQDDLFKQWCELAKHDGFTYVALRVVPDPVFPATSKTKPYVIRQECIVENRPDYVIYAITTATISHDVWARDCSNEKTKVDLLLRVRDAVLRSTPPGGTYVIRAEKRMTDIERGRRDA